MQGWPGSLENLYSKDRDCHVFITLYRSIELLKDWTGQGGDLCLGQRFWADGLEAPAANNAALAGSDDPEA